LFKYTILLFPVYDNIRINTLTDIDTCSDRRIFLSRNSSKGAHWYVTQSAA